MKTMLQQLLKPQSSLIAFSLYALSSLAWSADEYRINYRIERLDSNGVTTIQQYSDKMIRDEHNVWIERLNTQEHAHTEAGEHGHQSFDHAIQWLQKDKPSEMKTKDEAFQRFYILPDEKMRVRLKDVEQEMLGMRSCWRCEYSLIQPDLLMHIPAIQRHAGVQHYQMHQAGQTLNIVWNEKDQIVERYELRRPAQGYSKVFSVHKMKSPISTPWIQTEKYSDRDYSDFSD